MEHLAAIAEPGILGRKIERCGDELRIRPASRPINGALEALAAFSPSFLAEGREQDEQQERESL